MKIVFDLGGQLLFKLIYSALSESISDCAESISDWDGVYQRLSGLSAIAWESYQRLNGVY
jgi:hypothetical protein